MTIYPIQMFKSISANLKNPHEVAISTNLLAGPVKNPDGVVIITNLFCWTCKESV